MGHNITATRPDTAVVHYTKCSPTSTIASARIARYLADRFNADLIDHKEAVRQPLGFYRKIFFVNSPPLYCDFREEIKAANLGGTTCVWIQNDYAIDRFPRREMIVWSSVERSVAQFRDSYVNWNLLTYAPLAADGTDRIADGIFYHGAYRAGRERYFHVYFRGTDYYSYISASAKAIDKFVALGPHVRPMPPLTPLINGAAQYGMALYLEDEFSHRNYCSPANRFYELLSAGTAMLFDASCLWTFQKAGYDITPYIVCDANDVKKLLPRAKDIAYQQAAAWRRPYREQLDQQVTAAYAKLLRCTT